MVRHHRASAIFGLAGFAVASLLPLGALHAAEWSLSSDLSERVEVDTNLGFDENSDGLAFGSNTHLGLSLGARTKTTRWKLRTGTNFTLYGGPGRDAARNNSGLEHVNPSLSGSVRHTGKRFTANAQASFRRSPVAFTQFGLDPLPSGSILLPDGAILLPEGDLASLEDFTTVTSANGTRNKTTTRAGFTYFLDPVNRLSFSGHGSFVRFSGDSGELVPTTTYGGSAKWGHDFSNVTSGTLAFDVTRSTSDNTPRVENMIYSATGGLQTDLAQNLTFGFNAGVNATSTERGGDSDGSNFGFRGDARIAWELPATTLSLTAGQSTVPSSLGDLKTQTTLGLGIEHEINSRSSVDLVASYAYQAIDLESGNDNRQIFSLSPSYTVFLTREVKFSLGYIFRAGEIDDDVRTSNSVYMSISRSLDILN